MRDDLGTKQRHKLNFKYITSENYGFHYIENQLMKSDVKNIILVELSEEYDLSTQTNSGRLGWIRVRGTKPLPRSNWDRRWAQSVPGSVLGTQSALPHCP